MKAETIALLKQEAQSGYCPICCDELPHCFCDEINYEAEEHHVWDFYAAIDARDFEKAENHLLRINAI